jgi:galactose mutarotase-like enzyme
MREAAAEPFRGSRDGFQLYGLRSGELELAVAPELGAAVVSLRSHASGREWLWHPPAGRGLFANRHGDAFELGPLTGAVDCATTIAPCTVAGRQLPDHGEAWTARWRVDEAAFRDGFIRTEVHLPAAGLELTRSIRVNGAGARFTYTIANASPQPVPYLWAFHPLLAVEAGDRVELPACIRQLRAGAVQGYPEAGGVWNWPEPAPGIRLDHAVGPEGSYAKLFAGFAGHARGWCALRRGAEKLEFHFDAAAIPWLGLWWTTSGWNGCTHLAIEPASHAADSLAEAGAEPLAPGAQRSWSFEIRVKEVL